MASKSVQGMKSVLSISIDDGTNWIPVKQLKTVTYSGSKSDLEDITNMEAIREKHISIVPIGFRKALRSCRVTYEQSTLLD